MCILQGTKNYGHDMKTRHNQKQCRNRLISCVPVYTHMYTFYVKYLNTCKLYLISSHMQIWFPIDKLYAYDSKCYISMHHLGE